MSYKNRTNKEVALLLIAGVTIASVLPFLIYRAMHQQWAIVLFDLILICISAVVFYSTWKTHQTRVAALFVATSFTIAVNWMILTRGIEQVYWAFPACLSLYFILSARAALLFNVISVLMLIIIINTISSAVAMATFIVSIIACNAFNFILSIKQHEYQQQLILLGEKDPLTNVGNRRSLTNKLDELIYMNQRSRLACSMLLLDIDKFKLVNDKYGHNIGDVILKNLCNIISYRIRFSDKLFRFGGEEFIVTLEGTTLENAVVLAEKIRSSVEEEQLVQGISITVSIGVAELSVGETKEQWIDRADKALYQAKHDGRNKVYCAENLLEHRQKMG